jgi:hypothetical protein
MRNVYSDNLIEVTEWCMSLDPLSRPQSVFALQKELARDRAALHLAGLHRTAEAADREPQVRQPRLSAAIFRAQVP